MDKFVKTSRVMLIGLLMALLLAVYGLTLYRIQAIDTEAIIENSVSYAVSESTVYAARGSILDRNGVLLSSDKTVYDVLISRKQLLKQPDPNDIVAKLIGAAEKYGVSYSDTFPVTATAPFEYDAYASSTQKSWMKAYFEYFQNSLESYFHRELDMDAENAGITATELMGWMREHYGIDYTVTAGEARKIAGVRFCLEIRAIVNTTDYIFASDVPVDFIAYLSEQNLASVSINTRSVRQYHTQYAAHLLGYVGTMTRDQYESKYRDLGYPYNSTVGQTGAEAAFEEYLHGTPGSVTTYTDETGAVVNRVVTAPAVAGDNVYLTIDIGLQEAAENALAAAITQMNDERIAGAEADAAESGEYKEPELADGGGIVMLDVRSGEVLALASYPTYDLSTFYSNYAALLNDPGKPLTNRATNGLYNPGSTFKMVTAYAALSNLFISPSTTIYDNVVFTKYQDLGYSPKCWSSRGHGDLNVVGALENSCNYFFFSVGDRMGITRIADAARLFGFGSHTGIEIGDAEGEVASRELKQEKYHEGWWNADTLQACIGQGYNRFTPIQMANYVATIANGGTLYQLSVLKSVTSFDYSDVLTRRAPKVLSVIEDTGGYIPVLQQGMRAVASSGTARSALSNYRVPVAAKTGTVQCDNSEMNDGVCVCYAPADGPQSAIAVVVQKGGSGSALINIAKSLMDVYFTSSSSSSSFTVPGDGTLVR